MVNTPANIHPSEPPMQHVKEIAFFRGTERMWILTILTRLDQNMTEALPTWKVNDLGGGDGGT